MASSKPFVVGLEEHWAQPGMASQNFEGNERLFDLGDIRLGAMDEAGIDMQVLSHTLWRAGVNAETEVELAIKANNRLKEAVNAHPTRFGGFASLPMRDAQAGADELERAVKDLGFCGAMIFPIYDDEFIDEDRFWPVFERAAALDVPIYVHPARPHHTVMDLYYKKYLEEFSSISSAAWGFAVEAGTCAMRMIFSGMFDAYPNLKIILGHLGEFIPFGLERMEERINTAREQVGKDYFPFTDYFTKHFWVTTSGFFSTPALLCTILAMGVDRVMFSVDWPMNTAPPAMKWMETVPLSAEDKEKIFGGNAKRLLKLDPSLTR